jgi:hypothetical protein
MANAAGAPGQVSTPQLTLPPADRPRNTSETNLHSRRPTSPPRAEPSNHPYQSAYQLPSDSQIIGSREEFETDDDAGYESPDLDLDVDNIPVTGFAVASNKRNADFHELFPPVPEGDYLIEGPFLPSSLFVVDTVLDYGCALQREILIQGRLYISENHVCFHANIFGWITDVSLNA